MALLQFSKHLHRAFQTAFTKCWLFVLLLTTIVSIVTAAAENKPPTLKLSLPLMAKGRVVASEITPVNSLFAVLEVEDLDEGPNGEVTCEIDNPFIGLMVMRPNLYKIGLINNLDRETMSIVEVDISCTDHGTPALDRRVYFTIVVDDENDNAPQFDQDMYTFTLLENSPVDTEIGRVFAVDADMAENGMVKYYLEDENGQLPVGFTIDHEKGIILSRQMYDREEVDEVILYAYAADHGSPQLVGDTFVRINISDVNDNVPTILTKNMSIYEGMPPMSLVGTVTAVDKDTGVNAELEYSLVSEDDGSSFPPFIVETDGNVFSALNLDRELRDNYLIKISVSDSGQPPLSSVSEMNIRVLDVNDFPPEIHSPGDDYDYDSDSFISESVVIDWYSPDVDKAVYKVIAVDKDAQENGQIYYSIESINFQSYDSDSLFGVDRDSGRVFLRRFVRADDDPVQIVSFFVFDGGKPSLNATASLNVTLAINFSALTTPPTTQSVRVTEKPKNAATCTVDSYKFILFLYLCFFCFLNFKAILIT